MIGCVRKSRTSPGRCLGRQGNVDPEVISNATESYSRSHDAVIRVYDETRNVIDPVGFYFLPAVVKATACFLSGMRHLFPLSHYGHELFFDRGRSF
jgi:hypothetical protein